VERKTYERQIESLDTQIGRLAQLFAAGLFQMEEIAAQKGPLDAAKASCRKEIERIDGLLAGMQSVGERVNELSDLVRAIREKIEAGPREETKRIIIDLLDVQVLIVFEDGQKYADVTCHLTMDSARLLVAGVGDLSKTTTDTRTDSYLFAEP
jgi:hypothetical protein